jgi:CHAT domain-containing protein
LTGCLSNIAYVYTSLGDYNRAFEYASEAIKISQHGDMPRPLATQFINLGLAFQSRSRLEGTNEYYPRALECFMAGYREAMESGQASVAQSALANSALVYASLQEFEKALAILLPALKEAKKATHSGLSASLHNTLGSIYLERKDSLRAEVYFRAALSEAQRSGDIDLLLNATFGLGRCLEENGAFDQAINSYNDTIRAVDQLGSGIVNDVNRSDFICYWRKVYQQLIELDGRLLKKTGSGIFELDLFANVERMKSRSFLEYLERRGRLKESRAADKTKTREDKIKEERLGYLRQLSQDNLTPDKKGELENEIRQREEMLSTIFMDRYLRSGPQEIRTEPVAVGILQQEALRPDTALVEYFLGDERSYLILITNTLFKSFELPPARQIYDSLVGYLSFLSDPNVPPDRGFAAAQRLYKELFSPADGILPHTVSRLVIVPDGILFGLPFETLLRPAGERGGHEYLLSRYTITYSPSASALFYLQKKPRRSAYPKDLLALGDPVYHDQGSSTEKGLPSPSRILSELYKRNGYALGPLPFSRAEVERISKRFAAGKKDIYLGRQVTETFLKTQDLSGYRIIHFAGHAFSDETYPLRSTLVFSLGDDDEDGFLQASEMYGMRLDADLVVLSGCQTGGGKNIRNEGILGLPRIFFYMGARSVVATLWRIDDRATARFMDYFYDCLGQGLGKAEALRVSKEKMMASRRYAHPYFWSAFILTGEPQASCPSF